jgi:hypothetical protein
MCTACTLLQYGVLYCSVGAVTLSCTRGLFVVSCCFPMYCGSLGLYTISILLAVVHCILRCHVLRSSIACLVCLSTTCLRAAAYSCCTNLCAINVCCTFYCIAVLMTTRQCLTATVTTNQRPSASLRLVKHTTLYQQSTSLPLADAVAMPTAITTALTDQSWRPQLQPTQTAALLSRLAVGRYAAL